MRLSVKEIESLKKTCSLFFQNKEYKICLYGSRVQDHLKGGDVDIFLLSQQPWTLEEERKTISLVSYLKNHTDFGDQKINFSLITDQDLKTDPFWKTISNYIII